MSKLGPTRSQVRSAIMTTLGTPTGFVTVTDRFQLWPDVLPGEQPAIRILKGGEMTTRKLGLPPRRTWLYELWLYIQVPTGTDGASTIEPLMDNVEDALEPPPGQDAQTLGGLVSHAWIEGRTLVATGDLEKARSAQQPSGQATVIMPVAVLVP